MVSRGKLWHPAQLPGFVALIAGKIVGLVTYNISENQCEVVTLNSEVQGAGIGTALLRAACEAAIASGCRRMWLITTNDNLPALRFYQKRGMRLVGLYPNALDISRKLKPEIPPTGWEGIPIRDEIEFELILFPS
jgi:ribosomal protein S18 acetylase RimI-like enzyme